MLLHSIFIKQRKALTTLLFSIFLIVLILPHTSVIHRPLYGLHDIVNGEHLTIVQLWKSEGIDTHHFVPIFSFKPYDTLSRNAGLEGSNGRIYYASYPPLSFWIDYLIASFPGVQLSEALARIVSLSVFIIALCSVSFYLYKKYSPQAAILGAGMFSFVPASMYYFGSLDAPEITRFVFWIPLFILLTQWYKTPTVRLLLLYGVLTCLLSLTDWLGYILTGSICLYTLSRAIAFRKSKMLIMREVALGAVTLLSSLIALVGTIALYSSVSTLQNVFDLWLGKGSYRGNWSLLLSDLSTEVYGTASVLGGLHLWLQRTLNGYLWKEFGATFWLIIFALLIVFVTTVVKNWQHIRLKILENTFASDFTLLVIFFFIPPTVMALLLPQAHYIHDFYWLSFLPFFSMMAAVLYHWISKHRILPATYGSHLSFVIPLVLILLLYTQSLSMFHTLRDEYTGGQATINTMKLLTEVRTKTNQDDLILLPFAYQPNMWFYLGRNVLQFITIPGHVAYYNSVFPNFRHVYYVGQDKLMVETICGTQSFVPVGSGWMCMIQ